MEKREVKRLSSKDLPAYMEIYLNAYPAGKDLSTDCYDKYFSRNLQSLEEYENVNFFGLFENGVMISGMKLIDFQINLFGEMKKATGLMSLGVHPLYKKRGAARDMITFFENYTKETNSLVCMLLPFRMDFYRKLGYGCGSKLDEYHINVEQLPENRNLSGLKLLKKDDLSKILSCHTHFVENNHGALYKFEEELRDMSNDDDIRRLGYFKGNELKGYVAFTFINTSDCNYTLNQMDVKELIYDDQDTLSILLGGLRAQSDLAQSVKIRTGEPDFYHLLQNSQDLSGNYIDYGFIQTNISAVGTMYKIPDIKNFVEATAYRQFPATNLNIGFSVVDEGNDKTIKFTIRFSMNADKSYSFWSYNQSDEAFNGADVHMECRLSDLSALFMGSGEFGSMERLGILKLSNSAYKKKLDTLFHVEQKPFTNTDY